MNFFNNIKNRELLDTYYAPEFKERYENYKNSNDKNLRWQELSLENSICMKLNEEQDYSLPFFSSLFPDIFDLQDYKLLKKAKDSLQNYVILVGKIPYMKNADTANSFQLLLDDAISFGNKISNSLPDECGFVLSPYDDVTDIHLGSKEQVNSNSVADAEASFFNSSGVNMALFSSEKITEQSIRSSIQVDENLVFGIYRQLERWLNRKLKLCLNDDFKVKLLDVTQFNRGEVVKRLKEVAMYGIPVIRELCGTLGMSPLETEFSIKLEVDVMGLQDRLKPLVSSSTLSPDKINGRPQQKTEGSDGTTGKQQGEE
jgi:hypothetical protein